MAVDVLGLNDTFVTQLRNAIVGGVTGLNNVPMLLKCILKDDRWKERRIKSGPIVQFQRFEEFVEAQPLEGLGSSVAMIKRICSDDPEAIDLIDRALQRQHGGDRTNGSSKSDIITLAPRQGGTSQQQAIRKLRKDRPDLHARVLAGELSPNGAMVQAGFRQPRASFAVNDPESIVNAIWNNCTPEVINQVLILLQQEET